MARAFAGRADNVEPPGREASYEDDGGATNVPEEPKTKTVTDPSEATIRNLIDQAQHEMTNSSTPK